MQAGRNSKNTSANYFSKSYGRPRQDIQDRYFLVNRLLKTRLYAKSNLKETLFYDYLSGLTSKDAFKRFSQDIYDVV